MPLVFAPLIVPAIVFFGAIVLYALSSTSQALTGTDSETEAGGLIGWLKMVTRVSFGGQVIHLANKALRSTIAHWATAYLRPVTAWFTALTGLSTHTYKANAEVAQATAHGFERTTHVVIPRAVKRGVAPVKAQAVTAQHTATRAQRTASSTSHALTTYRTHTNATLRHHTHAIDVAIPQQLGRIRTRDRAQDKANEGLRERVGAVERGAIKTFEWIRSHPLSAATGVFAGAVAVALARMGFGFVRCRSWKNVGRRLTCGMGSLLEALLMDAIDVLVISDICTITTQLVRISQSGPVQTFLTGIVEGTDALMRCQGVDRPADPAPHEVALPARQTFAQLPSAA